MSTPNLKNKSIDELREMKTKGEDELKGLHNKSKYYDVTEVSDGTART